MNGTSSPEMVVSIASPLSTHSNFAFDISTPPSSTKAMSEWPSPQLSRNTSSEIAVALTTPSTTTDTITREERAAPLTVRLPEDSSCVAIAACAATTNNSNNSNNITLADEYHSRGFRLRKAGKFDAAVEEYSRALELNPRHFKAYFNRGFAYDKMERFDLAICDYTRAIELEPYNAYAYYNRGISKDRYGQYEGAVADFTR